MNFSNIGSVLLALLMLSVMITVHELGHFWMARLFGFPIFEFAVGFGPRILKRKTKKDTVISLRAFPFGGFVAFENEETVTSGNLTFNKKPLWQRFLVILAGPVTNILLAFLVAFITLSVVGLPVSTTGVDGFSENSPAELAGLKRGDVIAAVNGQEIDGDVSLMRECVQQNPGEPIALTVERDGQRLDFIVKPYYDEQSQSWMVGINLAQTTRRFGPGQSVKAAAVWIGSMIGALVSFLVGLFTRGEGAGDVMGVVGAVTVMSNTAQTQHISDFLTLVAFISMNFGVFNLIPFPALDGSKIVLMGVELIRKKPISPEKEGIVQLIGLVIFFALFLLLTYRDIMRLITGG
jgi:regulator of sigma E protease